MLGESVRECSVHEGMFRVLECIRDKLHVLEYVAEDVSVC